MLAPINSCFILRMVNLLYGYAINNNSFMHALIQMYNSTIENATKHAISKGNFVFRELAKRPVRSHI